MILIVDNYDSFTYNLYQSIALHEPEIIVARNDQISLTEIKSLHPAGIILSPGPGRPETAGICIELIQKADVNIPVLGVCLGHQAIVHAFGGKIIRASEIIHGKPELIFHHRQGLYKNLALPFSAGRYHSLIAERSTLPDVLIIEAETADGTIMGVRHRQFPIYGVQFHPESILTPAGDALLKNFVTQCNLVQTGVTC